MGMASVCLVALGAAPCAEHVYKVFLYGVVMACPLECLADSEATALAMKRTASSVTQPTTLVICMSNAC